MKNNIILFLSLFLFLSPVGALVSYAQPASKNDAEFLEMVGRSAFQYFIHCTNTENGLVMDRASNWKAPDFSYAPATIAGVGFGLSSLTVGAERGWIAKDKAEELTLVTLKYFYEKMENHKGFFYHFIDMKTGRRVWNCELSSVDTTLFLAGALQAGEYFNNAEIKKYADLLYRRVDWQWMLNGTGNLCMGWRPEKGFIDCYWKDYAESMLIYVMAIGSPTYPIPSSCWNNINRPLGRYGNYQCILCPPLFTHQFSHIWIDFRDKRDDYADYFQNSRQATLANRQFCIDSSRSFKTYGPDCWGLTACIGPDGYHAYGAAPGNASSDGTVAPEASGASIVFTPEESISALRYIYNNHKEKMWGRYGFSDSFNLDRNWYAEDAYAINQGPMLLMIENFSSELIWKTFMKNINIKRGMALAKFRPSKNFTFNMKNLKPSDKKVFFPHERPRYQSLSIKNGIVPDQIGPDDAIWKNAESKRITLDAEDIQSGVNGQPGYHADVSMAHNDKFLFIRVGVFDNDLVSANPPEQMYKDDAVEIYLDPDNDKLKWGNEKDYQIVLSPDKDLKTLRFSEMFQKGKNDKFLSTRFSKTGGGYEFVLAIQRKKFGLDNREAGFSIAFHNIDKKIASDCKLNWFFAEPGILLGLIEMAPGK